MATSDARRPGLSLTDRPWLTEFRNRIYKFTREQHPITFLSRRFDKGRHPKLPFYGIDKVEPDYYSLTQVCRQLRAEYTPIYAATSEVRVDEYDLDQYMENKCPMLMRDRYGKSLWSPKHRLQGSQQLRRRHTSVPQILQQDGESISSGLSFRRYVVRTILGECAGSPKRLT